MQTEKDKTTIAYGAKMNPVTDLMITSFTAQKLYETSFGEALGLPEIIRRPMLPDATGLFYLMPTSRKGDIDLIAGFSENDFKEIMKDVKWLKYTEFIG